MASLLDEVLGQQQSGDPTPLLQLPDERPPSLQPDPRVDALGQTFQAIVDYEKRKHQEGVDAGNWEGGWPWEGGHPTWQAAKGGVDEYAQSLLMGTTSSGGKYLKAYHGSPHGFDAFNDKAIGTGEGAQAYGYGHYLAENEGVARGYRDKLSNTPPDAISDAKMLLGEAKGDFSKAVEENRSMWKDPNSLYARQVENILNHWEKNGVSADIPSSGHMYEVNVAADPEKFLHWDKPLSEQHPNVQAALRPMLSRDQYRNMTEGAWARTPVSTAMPSLTTADTAARLNAAGVPGIRYLDAGSRNAKGEPTHNAVVFDPANMEIIRRYGLAGLMLGGGGLLSPDKQEQ